MNKFSIFRISSFQEFVFALCTLMTQILVIVKTFLLSVNKKTFLEVLAYLENHCWHTNYNSYEKQLLDKCRRMCIFFICTFNFFALGTATSYTVGPIIGKLVYSNSFQMKNLFYNFIS